MASALDIRTCFLGYLEIHERAQLWDMIAEECQNVSVVQSASAATLPGHALRDFLELEPRQIRSSTTISAEISKFRANDTIDMNPLEWWRQQEHNYPHLAALAKKFLVIPASSASSERVFSSAGFIVNKYRTRLLSSRVDELVFLNKNNDLFDEIMEGEDTRMTQEGASRKRGRIPGDNEIQEEKGEEKADQTEGEANELETSFEMEPEYEEFEDIFEALAVLNETSPTDEVSENPRDAAVPV